MTDYYIGQKVVCISTESSVYLDDFAFSDWWPEVGGVYTIKDISPNWCGTGFLMLQFEEQTDLGWNASWDEATNYRPVHETDISVFEKMLVDTEKEAEYESAND